MKRSFIFCIRSIIFIFLLSICQEQKASLSNGNSLHFMSAISSDPEMQKIIFKTAFYGTTFIFSATAILGLTALIKYIFFSKSDNVSKTISEKSAQPDQISLLTDKFKEIYQNQLKHFIEHAKKEQINAESLYQEKIKQYELILNQLKNEYSELQKNIQHEISGIQENNEKLLQLKDEFSKQEKEALIEEFNLKNQEYTLLINKFKQSIDKEILLMESNHEKFIKEINNRKEKEGLHQKEINEFKEQIDSLQKQYSEFIKTIKTENKATLDEFTIKIVEYKEEQKQHTNQVENLNLKLISEIKESNQNAIKQLQEKNSEIQKQVNDVQVKYDQQARQNLHAIGAEVTKLQEGHKKSIDEIKTDYVKEFQTFKQENEEKIKGLKTEHKEQIEKLTLEQKESLQFHKQVLEVQKEIAELQQEQNKREEQKHQWEKQDREEKERAERGKSKFLANNKNKIDKMIEKLTKNLKEIDFTKTDTGISSYQTMNTNFSGWNILDDEAARRNSIMVYAMQDLEFNLSTESEKTLVKSKITPTEEGYLLEDYQLKALVSEWSRIFEKAKQYETSHPEMNNIYQNNEKEVASCLNQIKKLIAALDPQKIDQKNNQNFVKISDSKDIEELFTSAILIFNIELQAGVCALAVFPFLSKDDLKRLELALKEIEKEKKLRKKDQIRQYKYFENDNRNNIKKYNAEIQEIAKGIAGNDYKIYEKYSDCQTYPDVISLLTDQSSINDQDRQIVIALLQKEYKMFQEAITKEKKARDLDPHRCSKYKNNKDAINDYLGRLQEIVASVGDDKLNEITCDQNKKYEGCIQDITFGGGYDEKIFANACVTNLGVKLIHLEDICEVLNKDEKAQIKNYYDRLKREYNQRKSNPARVYQWYIKEKKNSVEAIKKLIEELTKKISKNEEADNTYEQYQDILNNSDNKVILSQLIGRSEKQKDLDAEKLVDYLKNDLDTLRKTFESEALMRKMEPERCFIGKTNKNMIKQYNNHVALFIQNLTNTKEINEKINKQYEEICAFLNDQEIERKNQQKIHNDLKELFFAHTSRIFGIGYRDNNAIEVYNILNFENKNTVGFFLEKIHGEINARKSDSKRAYEWYINDKKLENDIKEINDKISVFVDEVKKENFQYENLEKLYLVYCKAKNERNNQELDDEVVVRLLVKNSDVNLKDVIVENIKYHINLKLFKEAMSKEQNARLQKPERSFYYQVNKQNIDTIFQNIDSWNAVLGDSSGEVSEEANNFYLNITLEFIFADTTLQNKQFFLNAICKFLKIQDTEKILFLLSQGQIQKIDYLYNKIKKEIELRKVYASRALSQADKTKLAKFRKQLKGYVDDLANASLVTNQNAVNALGTSVVAYQDSLLYEELFKVFKIDDNNGSISKFLDEDDKSKINSLQGLLREALEKINTQKDELEREKRLLEHVASVSQMQYTNYIVDGISERDEVEDLEKRINEKNNELVTEEADYNKKIKTKEGEIENKKGENAQLFSLMKKDLAALEKDLKEVLKDFECNDNGRKKEFFQSYLKFYIEDQDITFKYADEKEGKQFILFDEEDLNALFRFNLGIKSSNNYFLDKQDFWKNISHLSQCQKDSKTVLDREDGLDYGTYSLNNEHHHLFNIIYLIEFLIEKMNIDEVHGSSILLKISFLYNLLSLSTLNNIDNNKLSFLIVFIMNKQRKINNYDDFTIRWDGYKTKIKEINQKKELEKEFEDLYVKYVTKKSGRYFCKKLKSLLTDESIIAIIKKILSLSDFESLLNYFSSIKKYKLLYNNIFYSYIKLNKEVEMRSAEEIEGYESLKNFILKKSDPKISVLNNQFDASFYHNNNKKSSELLYSFFNNIDKMKFFSNIESSFQSNEYGFDDKLINSSGKQTLLEERTTQLKKYILGFKFYFNKNVESSFTEKTDTMIEDGKQFDKNRELIIKEQQELATQKLNHDSAVCNFNREIISLKKNMNDIQKVVSDKESGKILSEKSLYDIPERMLIYLFNVQISTYIDFILNMKEAELLSILRVCKTLQPKETIKIADINEKNNSGEEKLEKLFTLLEYVSLNNIQGFLKNIILNFLDINDVQQLKNYLKNIKEISYNVNTRKGHFLLYGPAGTGKSEFLKSALPHYIDQLKNTELKEYLKNNCYMYTISKGNFNKEETLQGGLGKDIQKMLSVLKKKEVQTPMLVVVYDECDAFVAKRDDKALSSSSKDDTNALLTLFDHSTKIPFCFCGTTNARVFDEAATREGRFNAVLVDMPTYNSVKKIISTKKEEYQKMLSANICSEKETLEIYLNNCGKLLNIDKSNFMNKLKALNSGVVPIFNGIKNATPFLEK